MFHFYFQTPNIADWIMISLSIITILIGIYALNRWQKEKQWDIVLEALANAQKSVNYYYYLLNSFRNSHEFSMAQNIVLREQDYEGDEDYVVRLKEPQTNEDLRYIGFDDTIFMINEKLNRVYDKHDNELKDFYNSISEKIIERERTIERFNDVIISINTYRPFGEDKEVSETKKRYFEDLFNELLRDNQEFTDIIKSKITSIKQKNIKSFL